MNNFYLPRSLLRLSLVSAAVACSPRQAVPVASTPALASGVGTADSLVASAIGKLTPGAVLVISVNGHVVHEKAFGTAVPAGTVCATTDSPCSGYLAARPMRLSTMFDLASVTKVMATTFAMMLLVDRGKVDLDAHVYTYLPDFRGPHLDSIRVRHLLQHSAGLVQWQPLYYQASTSAQTYAAIRDMPLQWGVGEGRHYSDLSFMLLGDIVEKASGQQLDQFISDALYQPLGLRHTTFNPKQQGFTDFAATEQGNSYEHHMVYDSTFMYRYRGDPRSWKGWRDYALFGEVNDGNSFYASGGVAGHAGLFSTGGDLRVLLDMLVARGTANGHRYVTAETVGRFLTLDAYGHFLGWQSAPGTPAGSFSHTGFTGTYVLGVPADGLSIILLTNKQRMGTDAKGFFPNLAPLQSAVARAIINGAEADATRKSANR